MYKEVRVKIWDEIMTKKKKKKERGSTYGYND